MVTPRNPHNINIPYPWVAGLERQTQEQLYMDFLALGRGAQGTRWATIVIAAVDSTPASKASADYTCDAGNAATIINAAIDSLLAIQSGTSTPVGRIVLLEGTYNVGSTSVGSSSLGGRAIHIQGMGGLGRADTIDGTVIKGTGVVLGFAGSGSGGGSSIMLSDLQVVSTSASLVSAAIVLLDIPSYVTRCMVINGNGGSGIATTSTLGAPAATRISECHVYIPGGDTGITVNGGSAVDEPCFVTNNYVKFSGTNAQGILCRNNSSTVPSYQVSDNYLIGGGTSTGIGIKLEGNSIENCNVNGNTIVNVGTGIKAAGYRHLITGNLIQTVDIGYDTLGSDQQLHAVIGNHVVNCTTAGFRFGTNAATAMVSGTIAFNRISGGAGATAVVIGTASSTNCGVFYNDWYGCAAYISDSGTGTRTEGWFLTAAMLPNHHTAHETGGADAITGSVDGNARVGVRKNTGATTYKRRRVNFIEGSNIALTVAEDAGNEEVDVTIAAASGLGTLTVKKNGSTVGAENTMNLIEGTGTTLTVTDSGTEIDITVTASSATSAASSAMFNHLMMR